MRSTYVCTFILCSSVLNISKPVLGIFYNEETSPTMNMTSHLFDDSVSKYFSYHLGATFSENLILNVIHIPAKDEWTTALSVVY